jgi:hypothetical protein
LSSTTAVVAANLNLLFTPDDRGYSKFNRSAIRFLPDFGFSKIRGDSTLPKSLFRFFSSSKPIVYEPGVIKIKLFISINALIFIYPEP